MTFVIEVNGRRRMVTVEASGPAGRREGRFHVTLADLPTANPGLVGTSADGTDALDVDVRETDLGISLVYLPDQRSIDAAVTEQGPGEWLVDLPGVSLTALVDGRRFRAGTGPSAGTGEQRVTAPMPGRIVRVLVAPGDEVAARQPLVVIEAMKMENELVAERAGRVREVPVSEGMSVDAGRLLVRIE